MGKVLGAKVEVYRLSDGLRFGNKDIYTDTTTGLVTIQTCNVNQPMLVVLKGVDGARYYDEGKDALLPFGPDQELHALVDKMQLNIGVSAMTEAAYRYAINNFVRDPKKIVDGTDRLETSVVVSELSKLTARQIVDANQIVMNEINRTLPAPYKLTSLTALPTPLGPDNRRVDLLPTDEYGQAAMVTGALSWASDKFRIGSLLPALSIAVELSRDMTDGKIDGFALDGSKAATTPASYESAALPINLTVGANVISKQFSTANHASVYEYTDLNKFRKYRTCSADDVEIRYALTKNGTIDLLTQVYKAGSCMPDGTPVPDPAFTAAAGSNIKEIFTAQYSGGGFFVNTSGQVFSWGDSTCGQIANGQSSGFQSLPRVIAGLNNITSLANGQFFAIARDNDGRVYSWGGNDLGALGLGSSPPLDATCFSTGLNAVTTPKQVTGLSDITQVFAHQARAWALNKAGRLYSWGNECGRQGGGGISSVPVLLAQPTDVRSMAANDRGCFALKADGTLVGWGFYNNVKHGDGSVYDDGQWFGDGTSTPKVSPTPLTGLTDVREIASDRNVFYALKSDGSVWRWGGEIGVLIFETPTPIEDLPKLPSGKTIPIRHMKSDIDGVHLFADDGRIFVSKWGPTPYLTDLAQDLDFK